MNTAIKPERDSASGHTANNHHRTESNKSSTGKMTTSMMTPPSLYSKLIRTTPSSSSIFNHSRSRTNSGYPLLYSSALSSSYDTFLSDSVPGATADFMAPYDDFDPHQGPNQDDNDAFQDRIVFDSTQDEHEQYHQHYQRQWSCEPLSEPTILASHPHSQQRQQQQQQYQKDLHRRQASSNKMQLNYNSHNDNLIHPSSLQQPNNSNHLSAIHQEPSLQPTLLEHGYRLQTLQQHQLQDLTKDRWNGLKGNHTTDYNPNKSEEDEHDEHDEEKLEEQGQEADGQEEEEESNDMDLGQEGTHHDRYNSRAVSDNDAAATMLPSLTSTSSVSTTFTATLSSEQHQEQQVQQHQGQHETHHHSTNFISEDQFLQLAEEYLLSLSPKKREKALLSNAMYQKILMVLLQPKNTQVSTAQFRFWAKKMFTLSTTATHHLVCHSGKPVATKECLYDVLVYCHRKSAHGGRDKTSAEVRQHYSWVPKELIARFVKHCPLCHSRRNNIHKQGDTALTGGGSSTTTTNADHTVQGVHVGDCNDGAGDSTSVDANTATAAVDSPFYHRNSSSDCLESTPALSSSYSSHDSNSDHLPYYSHSEQQQQHQQQQPHPHPHPHPQQQQHAYQEPFGHHPAHAPYHKQHQQQQEQQRQQEQCAQSFPNWNGLSSPMQTEKNQDPLSNPPQAYYNSNATFDRVPHLTTSVTAELPGMPGFQARSVNNGNNGHSMLWRDEDAMLMMVDDTLKVQTGASSRERQMDVLMHGTEVRTAVKSEEGLAHSGHAGVNLNVDTNDGSSGNEFEDGFDEEAAQECEEEEDYDDEDEDDDDRTDGFGYHNGMHHHPQQHQTFHHTRLHPHAHHPYHAPVRQNPHHFHHHNHHHNHASHSHGHGQVLPSQDGYHALPPVAHHPNGHILHDRHPIHNRVRLMAYTKGLTTPPSFLFSHNHNGPPLGGGDATATGVGIGVNPFSQFRAQHQHSHPFANSPAPPAMVPHSNNHTTTEHVQENSTLDSLKCHASP